MHASWLTIVFWQRLVHDGVQFLHGCKHQRLQAVMLPCTYSHNSMYCSALGYLMRIFVIHIGLCKLHECLLAMIDEALTSTSSASVSRPENWHSTELIAALTPFPDGNWLGCKIAAQQPCTRMTNVRMSQSHCMSDPRSSIHERWCCCC